MNTQKRNGIWKKWLVVAMTFAMLLSMCGCIRYRLHSTVHEDGSVDVTLLYAIVDTSSFDEEGSDGTSTELLTDSQKQALAQAGWTYEDYTGEPGDSLEYIGYRISKSGIAFDDLQAELTSEAVGITGFSCSKDGDVYIMNWDVSTEQSDASTEGVDDSMLEEYGGYMELELELPNGALYENSTSKSGNLYTWKIMQMNEAIHVEFTLDGSVPAGYETQPTTETKTTETESTSEETTESTTEPTIEITTDTEPEETTEETTEEETEKTKKTKKTKATDEDDDDEDDEEEPSEKSKKNKKNKKSDDDDKSFPIWALVAIAGGVVVVAGAVVAVVLVKRKNTQS